ncbi:ABC-type transport auxiliary lipoprotein family protein [Azoarcus indigens]|nr:ABC-type transport auxiliary lipoprotein family protein [Azoarcus indigens]
MSQDIPARPPELIATMPHSSPLRVSTLLGAIALTACNSIVPVPRTPALYDLPLPDKAQAERPLAGLLAVEITSPTWLRSAAMQYRLDGERGLQRRSYADSRWVAQPAEMLSLALTRSLAAGEGTGGRCVLSLELDEFIQVFDSADRSHAAVALRATLLRRGERRPLATTNLRVSSPAPSADAEGGVQAYRVALAQLGRDIQGWAGALTPACIRD